MSLTMGVGRNVSPRDGERKTQRILRESRWYRGICSPCVLKNTQGIFFCDINIDKSQCDKANIVKIAENKIVTNFVVIRRIYMKERIENLRAEIKSLISQTQTGKGLYEVKVKFQTALKDIMSGMKSLPKEEKPTFGKIVNEFKQAMEAQFEERAVVVKQMELEAQYEKERIDITMPGKKYTAGALHPITLVKNELIDIFAGMGFKVFEGPEIETDYYNFTALNTPKDHPARDMQDTFYLADNLLLRTQTSAGQIRVMEQDTPPIKILSPGRVFRSDDDATHSPMFHQMEGLVVDKGITLCDLQGMLAEFARKMFTSSTKVRLRPSYFPFTEPSVEVDLSCSECGGKGCRLCKGTGWIEVLGAGMVNRHVLENCNVDPDEYTGFAFGMGIERIAMLKYGINNIKTLFENDTRFLKQFED